MTIVHYIKQIAESGKLKILRNLKFLKQKQAFVATVAVFVVLASVSGFLLFKNKKPQDEEKVFGTLVLNTNKMEYATGEEVYIQIASLDSEGKTLCSSNLELSVSPILHSTFHILPVSPSSTCILGSVSNSPDYYAYFKPTETGQYKIILTNRDDGNTLEKDFTVSPAPLPFSISRWSATRVLPNISNRYPMIITVSSATDFEGEISDSIPQDFEFAWVGNAKISEADGRKVITWNVKLKAKESMELKYEYIPSTVTNTPYETGPILASDKLVVNSNIWQIFSQGIKND